MIASVSSDNLAQVAQLRSLQDILAGPGVTGVSAGYPELFEQNDRFLRVNDDLLIFRVQDLRSLGADRRVANVPADVFMKSVFSGPADNPLLPSEGLNLRRYLANLFFTTDPKTHSAVKRIFTTPLMAKAMPPFAAIGHDIVRGFIERLAGTETVDVMKDIAQPMAYAFWGNVLGIEPGELSALRAAVERMGPIATGAVETREELIDADAAVVEYLEIFKIAIQRALRRGGHIYLPWMQGQLAAITEPLPAMPESLEAFVAVNLIDGFHAMTVGLTAAVNELLDHPEEFDAVRADPALAGSAVDEALRLNGAVPIGRRYLYEDVDYEGVHLPAGSQPLFHWHAGNHDPSFCDRPTRFDIMRSRRPSLTFGTGVQLCPGRNVTRTLAMAGVRAFADSDVVLERAGETTWRNDSLLLARAYPKVVPVRIALRS